MIPQPYRNNFDTLSRAFDAGDACLLECHDRKTGEPVYVLCAVNRRGGDYELVPFARLFDGNPYELLAPPGELQDQDEPQPERNSTMTYTDDTKEADTPEGLPPDPEGMNESRSAWAGLAIAAFMAATGTDPEDALTDLLADLMHWSDRQGYDFAAVLQRGRDHYEAETTGE